MNMENLHAGIYRRLKDRGIPVTDKIKLVKFAWKSDRVIIPNKEQVLIDFMCGLLLNRKRNNLTENDVAKIWICFCEILNSRKIFQKTAETPIIIVKPSICQVINDRLSLEVDKSHSDDASIAGHVLSCSFAILVSPALSYMFSTKLDYMINLLSAVAKLTVKYLVNKTTITQTQIDLLKKCIEVYRSCQRGHPNQKQVLQLFVEKLFVPSVTLRFLHELTRLNHSQRSDAGHYSNGLGMYHHPDGLGQCVDGLMNVLEESLFHKDHNVSYDMYLSIICGTGELKSQPPKVIENIFTAMSNCIYGKTQLAYATADILQRSFTDYLPVFFKAFLENECHGDNTIAHWLFSHICSVIGLKSNTSDLCGPLKETVVLGVISSMLIQIQKCDVYSVTEDKSAENTQLKYYRHILDVLLKCKRSPEFYSCLLHLFQLNHEILEPNLVNVFQNCWLNVDQSVGDDYTIVQALDAFLAEIVTTYSKLRQVGRWLDKLLVSVTNSNTVNCLLIPSKFSSSFRNVIHALPQITTVDLWKKFVDVLKDECLPQLFYNEDVIWIRRLQDIINFFHLYTTNMRIADYGITEITFQRVKEMMDIIPTDIIKPLIDLAVEQKKHDILTSVLLLCHSWGEIYMLLNQYKPEVVQHTQSQTAYVPSIYCVHKYITENTWTKIHSIVLMAKDYRSQYLWDLLLVQELRLSLCAQTVENTDNRTHIEKLLCQILHLPSEVTDEMMAATWDKNFQNITSDNTIVAKWDTIIHLLPLVVSVISVAQSKTLSDFVVNVMTKSHQSEKRRFREDTACHSLLALTKDFLKCCTIKECESLQLSLVTTVMSEVKNNIQPKNKSGKKKKPSKVISQVMAILHLLTYEDVTWFKDVDSSQLIYLQKIAEKVNELILYDDEVLLSSISDLSLYLEILSYLPLSHLSVTNQLRCVYGLITILKVTFPNCCDISRSLNPRKLQIEGDNGGSREITSIRETELFGMDLLTLLVESMGQAPLFQLLDICVYWEWISTLYNLVHNAPVLFREKIDLLVGVTWHSIFKDFQVVLNMSPCIEMIKDKLQTYGTEMKQDSIEKKRSTQFPVLPIMAALFDELEKVLNRVYLKEEVKAICDKYYKDLADCLNKLVTNVRKSSLPCPAILVKCFSSILYLIDVDNMESQKMLKKNFIYMISVCTGRLDNIEAAEKVLEDAALLKSNLYLWKQLLQYELSEEKYSILCHAVQSSIIQLIKDLDGESFITDIAIPVLNVQVLMLNYGPQLMSPQTAVLSFHSCQDLPLDGAVFISSFHAIIRLLLSVIHEGSQDKLSSDPERTQEILICAQFVDRKRWYLLCTSCLTFVTNTV
ncbi:hypothetical protein KUTeg_015329 [Tegillarca granosa]|uniref:Uncharacterized protein n=1 Tax=Tegillarca granosa TaxID=220873 RepID=A0ABQ9EV21_TEGGR|nr:hypothetical protein KUTeg_015329 [Tegillarca granosa]